jgi:putative membrane protein
MNKLLLALPALLTTTPALAQVMTPSEYVMSAGAGDLYERTSSQIVLQTTSDPRVREFATMMIEHHTKSSQDVTAAARQSGLKPMPPKLNPAQTEMVAQLRASSGSARDAAYIAQQKAAHGQALDIQKAYAMEGGSTPLRGAAAMIVPVVEHHVEMLHAM